MRKCIDLTGRKFGHWTVLEKDSLIHKKNIYWLCKCDCGTVRSVAGTSLRSGISVSCGCNKNKNTIQRNRDRTEDLTGKTFGYWTVLCRDKAETSAGEGTRWICRCICGKQQSNLGYALRLGRSTSCGCRSNRHFIDLSGQQFGKLTVVSRDTTQNKKYGVWWICECECGNKVSVSSGRLRSGATRSCGCLKKTNQHVQKELFSGERYGHWTVLSKAISNKNSGIYYLCKCDCGTEKKVLKQSLLNGRSQSCGCLNKSQEDLSGTQFYRLFVLNRETNPKDPKHIYYKCLCNCGNETIVSKYHLTSGHTKSCGCLSRDKTAQHRQENLAGQQFGNLTVTKISYHDNRNQTFWECDCSCGNKTIVIASSLKKGYTRSCGCLQKKESARRATERIVDLKGQRFGKLTVLERIKKRNSENKTTWLCKCDCGNEITADGYHLKKGMISSCGCLKLSKYEFFVLEYFNEKNYFQNVDYKQQIKFDDLIGINGGYLSYDFAKISDDKITVLIECQGQQHYQAIDHFGGIKQFEKQQQHDLLKKEYAQRNGIPLIEIPYTAMTYDEVKDILLQFDI